MDLDFNAVPSIPNFEFTDSPYPIILFISQNKEVITLSSGCRIHFPQITISNFF
jgi:hypothetical protein